MASGRPKLIEGAVPLGVTVTADQREWLDRQALVEDRTVSAIIRRLISEERDRLAPVEVEGKP